MEELIVTSTMPTFQNKELATATKKIFDIGNKMKKNLYAVAVILAGVEASECYKDDGYKSATEYAQKVLGFKKSAAYSLIKIGKEYTDKAKQESNIPHLTGKDYSTTQVEKLMPLGREKVLELNSTKEISPEMTVKEIKEVVKKYTPQKEAPEVEEQEEEEVEAVEGEVVEEKGGVKAPDYQEEVVEEVQLVKRTYPDGRVEKLVYINGSIQIAEAVGEVVSNWV